MRRNIPGIKERSSGEADLIGLAGAKALDYRSLVHRHARRRHFRLGRARGEDCITLRLQYLWRCLSLDDLLDICLHVIGYFRTA